jgi:ferredoxin-NADP reductase/MOSC domain-containing protein YiiM/ferredoxin
MRLLSVNVGMPRQVGWHGRQVTTAIFKHPVEGPRFAGRLNLEGDRQADLAAHGGEHRAVFVYQIESYRYWQAQLGRQSFAYGQFGENFTVEGLPDNEVCIGDRYRIGTAVFEVTQPRVTCYRVGIALGDPRMPALLVSHRRPGFYLRVLHEGVVEAGQEIIKIAPGPQAMTVAEIDALLYLPHRSRRDLARALRIPALSQGWKGSFQELLDQDRSRGEGHPAAASGPSWAGFRPLQVMATKPESAGVLSIMLALPDHQALAPPLAGQFLAVRLRPDPAQPPLTRSYSLSGPPGASTYRISVKREPGGAASGYLHTAVSPGDVIEAAAPRGSFVLQPGERPVVLISAGAGATPVLAMLHALAAQGSQRQVWWLHGARNRAEHAFRGEAHRLLASLPHGHRLVCYSAPGPGDRPGRDFDHAGRLTGPVLDQAGVPTDADFYLCGPVPFMHDLAAALAARGVTPGRIRTEIFGPAGAYRPGVPGVAKRPPHPPAGAPGSGPLVSFGRSNLAVRWDPSFGSLLEFAEACDIPVGFGCRTGVCHACETGLVSGNVTYSPEPLEPPGPGQALVCCAQPRTDLWLDL